MPKASADGGHVTEAESRGLGNADEKFIVLKRIGVGGGTAPHVSTTPATGTASGSP
jgi:hypothetical protein